MNAVDIQEVLKELQKVAPASWEYPGYISTTIAGTTYGLGEHTGGKAGYSWNDEECTVSGEIEDLISATGVVRVFLSQVNKAR